MPEADDLHTHPCAYLLLYDNPAARHADGVVSVMIMQVLFTGDTGSLNSLHKLALRKREKDQYGGADNCRAGHDHRIVERVFSLLQSQVCKHLKQRFRRCIYDGDNALDARGQKSQLSLIDVDRGLIKIIPCPG